jgi:putative ABC transport system permease protein
MRHWSQLATRNWRSKRLRTLGAVLAIALGVGAVVWVTCCYESVRQTIAQWAGGYVGATHIIIESPLGKYDQIPQRLVSVLREAAGVREVIPRLVQRLGAVALPNARKDDPVVRARGWDKTTPQIDLHGVDLASELMQREVAAGLVAGRPLRPDDRFACVLDAAFAAECGAGVGDVLLVWRDWNNEGPTELEIVGLAKRRRIARFQKGVAYLGLPILQLISGKQALITSAEVLLQDGSRENIERMAAPIRAAVRRVAPSAIIKGVEQRMRQIEAAQSQQQFVLVLLSCVAMLTALFIILSTLSMGMIERISQLGLMRCIGLTRMQLAWLVLLEVVPLGVIGIIAGVPIGLALTYLTVWLVPDYVGAVAISWNGVLLAAAAGLVTTILAALLPAFAAVTVSPLEAARPRARRPRRFALLLTALLAAVLLAVQHFAVVQQLQRSIRFVQGASLAVVLLYIGYALAAPLAVWLIGSPAIVLVARSLAVRTRLLADQVGHAIWRSAGICCGLMVGLSLIVGLVTFNRSIQSGWQFPSQFPEAYIWSFEQLRADARARLERVPGIGTFTVANAINVIVEERPVFMEQVLLSVTWFLGIEPDSFFDLVRMEFVEGNARSARELLKEGGYVLVADDFCRARNKHLGDEVKVFMRQRVHTFRIAGVVQSPALDIAAGYFQAQSELNTVASGSVMGTNADLKRCFDVSGTKMVLLNFDLPPHSVPPDWKPPGGGNGVDDSADDHADAATRERQWQRWREAQVLRDARAALDAPQAFAGTARELKDEIDRELTRMTTLLTAVPGVAMLVAAIGVANLMTANVLARARQLAILRAVGATRGLILRLVVGEALLLGVLGSALGLALGFHLAIDTTTLVDRMWGFRVTPDVPWDMIALAVALTLSLCILAGTLPARHAARTNIVDALHVA